MLDRTRAVPPTRRRRRGLPAAFVVVVATATLTVGAISPAGAQTSPAAARTTTVVAQTTTAAAQHEDAQTLAPRTHFTMAPDGSSGATQGGEGIPNIDSVKKTIATYYGDPGTGIANKVSSPYISEMNKIVARLTRELKPLYEAALRRHEKPALVFDTDDTTLWTYDMEVGDMHFNFNPAEQDVWVQDQRFPATPAMVAFVNKAAAMGFTVFGLTGRNDNQKAATVANLKKDGYKAFAPHRFYTKWTGVGTSVQPSYIHCAAVSCTTVEYKAGTRAHIERLGYTIVENFGDQYSDLQGGHAQRSVKLPNPTYYLPSPNLPGLNQPRLTPRTHFVMAPDGSSGATQSGEGIPNIDSVKKTIATYYGDPGTGISNKVSSPYITEMTKLVNEAHSPAGCKMPCRVPSPREAGHRLRRGRHHPLDLRHGGGGDALQLRPGAAGRLGPGRALPGDPGYGRAGEQGSCRRLYGRRPDRPER